MTSDIAHLDTSLLLDKLTTPAPALHTQERAKPLDQRSSGGFPAKKLALILGALIAITAAGYGGYRWWQHAQTWVDTDNAYVAADIHEISPRIVGTISEVLVDENQNVAAGAVLARIDARDLEVRQRQAAAQVAQCKAQLDEAVAQIAKARADVAHEQALLSKARMDVDRVQTIHKNLAGAVSKQDLDNAQAAFEAATAGLNASQAAVAAAEAQTSAVKARQLGAEASLADADLQLSYTEITAPMAGRIGRKSVESGNSVQPGQALFALVEPTVWVTANLKETQLTRVQNHQTVEVEVDAFPGHMFTGQVQSLSPASGAQFALLPPDNATGNFTKIVQRVPVKVILDPASLGDFNGRVVPGMSVVVKINVRS